MKHLASFENFGHETHSSTTHQDLNHKEQVSESPTTSPVDHQALIKKIQSVLSPDLLKGKWKDYDPTNPMKGQCYSASNALYWMLGGPEGEYKPYVITNKHDPTMFQPGESHWFLMNKKGDILDPTKEQFDQPVKYGLAQANGMFSNPVGGCKRARTIMDRVKNLQQ